MTIPRHMTAIAIASPGGPEALTPVSTDVPAFGDTDVLIRVAAAGINGPDLAQRRGAYPPPPGFSPLPGLEVAGEIAALGAKVPGLAVGDQVMALTNGGGYAEYAAVPHGQVLPLPTFWSMEEAAALPETWFTVTQTLVMRAGLSKGMSVLVHGGAGGIGGAAIAISAALGAKPIAIVSSAHKADYARAMGAAETIDRTREDFVERTLALTGGKGADRIVDVVGGEVAAQNVAASARGGHIVQISTLAGGTASIPLREMMSKDLTLSGSLLRPQSSQTKAVIAERIHAELFVHLERRDFPRPRLTVFSFEDAPAAHRAMETSEHFGKIVLLTDWGRRRSI
ncbi:NAD(P)H-quinone oxidoreductase [Devosia nitrariae]|nr:NAD(P)H-quinone oxidoreductase [Devosia nitrariae]